MTEVVLSMEPQPKSCPYCEEPLGVYAPDDPGLAAAMQLHQLYCANHPSRRKLKLS